MSRESPSELLGCELLKAPWSACDKQLSVLLLFNVSCMLGSKLVTVLQ